MENISKKQPYGGCLRDARPPSWSVAKLEDDEYEKRLKELGDILRLKYDRYRRIPKSCPHYDFYNRKFNKYYKGELNFYTYWNEKMNIECGYEKQDAKVRIWKEVKQFVKDIKHREQQVHPIKPKQSTEKTCRQQFSSDHTPNKRRR